jgi:hypothetical protein
MRLELGGADQTSEPFWREQSQRAFVIEVVVIEHLKKESVVGWPHPEVCGERGDIWRQPDLGLPMILRYPSHLRRAIHECANTKDKLCPRRCAPAR